MKLSGYLSKNELKTAASQRVKGKKSGKRLQFEKLKPFKPMLATLADQPFDDQDWIFEAKLDGYRAITIIQNGSVEIYSRNLKLFNGNFPALVRDLENVKHQVILDGEIVAENKKGRSSFQLLQNTASGNVALKYYVFDLLHLNGNDLHELPLIERKKLLKVLIESSRKLKNIHYSEHVSGKGLAFFQKAVKKNLEGIIAKKADSIYRPNIRTANWLKLKINLQQEMIILGITSPKGSRKYFGSLLLGYYDKGKLRYAGNCGTGFTDATLEMLYRKASNYFISRSPLSEKIAVPGEVQWIKPHLVCQVKFTEWTDAGNLRHPVYLGLRTDKKARQITREKPTIHHEKT